MKSLHPTYVISVILNHKKSLRNLVIFFFTMILNFSILPLFPSDKIEVKGKIIFEGDMSNVPGVKIQAWQMGCDCPEDERKIAGETIANNLGLFSLILPAIKKDYTLIFTHPQGYICTAIGAINKSQDLGTLQIPQPVRIQGRVYDEAGKPIHHVPVLMRMNLKGLKCPIFWDVAQTSTDGNGYFSFSKLTPETYRVRLLGNDYEQVQIPVNLPEDGNDLQIISRKAAWISGRVSGPGGKGMPGVTVKINRSDYSETEDQWIYQTEWTVSQNNRYFWVRTDKNGFYRIGGLGSHRYVLQVYNQGYFMIRGKKISLNLIAGRRYNQDIQMVNAGDLNIEITGKENSCLPDTLSVSLKNKKDDNDQSYSLVANVQSGYALFKDILPGSYQLKIHSRGFSNTDFPVTIIAGETARVAIALIPPDQSMVFQGQVLCDRGQPVAGARIEFNNKTHTIYQWAETDTNGAFTIKGLQSGIYELSINHPLFLSLKNKLKVETSSMEPIKFFLKSGDSLAGKVLNEKQQPVMNAQIQLAGIAPQDQIAEGTTDSNGNFILHGLKSGMVWLQVQSKKYEPFRKKLQIQGKSVLEEPVILKEGLTLRGRVVNSQGNPVCLATVQVEADQNESHVLYSRFSTGKTTVTDIKGNFSISGISAGKATLKCTAKKLVNLEKEILVDESYCLQPLLLTMQPGFRITGRVIESDGTVCDSAEVRAYKQNNQEKVFDSASYSGIIDSKGQFVIEDMPAGSYNLDISDKRNNEHIMKLANITAGKEDILARLPILVPMNGLVTDQKGITLVGVAVGLATGLNLNYPRERTVTNAEGRFDLRLRCGAKYQLFLQHPDFLQKTEIIDLTGLHNKKNMARRFVLVPGCSVSGRVINSLDDSPMAGVVIQFEGEERSFSRYLNQKEKKTVTKQDGTFQLKAIPHGLATLIVSTPEQETTFKLAEKRILVKDKDLSEVVITVGIIDTGSVKVKILIENGFPAAGSHVILQNIQDPDIQIEAGETDANGEYVFKKIPIGNYLVLCPLDSDDPLAGDESSIFDKMELVVVNKDKITEVLIKVKDQPGESSIKGTIRRQGELLKSGWISFIPETETNGSNMEDLMDVLKDIKRVKISAQGEFMLETLSPGEYLYAIEINKNNKSMPLSGRINISKGQKTIALEIQGIQVGGIVSGDNGSPVQDATISLEPRQENKIHKMIFSREASTGSNGRFHLENILPGIYDIKVRHSEWAYFKMNGVSLKQNNTALSCKLKKGFSIKGKVNILEKTSKTGAAIIVIDGEDIMATASVDEKGNYQTRKIIPPGFYDVYIGRSGYAIDVCHLNIQNNFTHNVTLHIGGSLTIKLQGLQDEIQQRKIILKDSKGNEVQRLDSVLPIFIGYKPANEYTDSLTDKKGQTTIHCLKPGIYSVNIKGISIIKKAEVKALENTICQIKLAGMKDQSSK